MWFIYPETANVRLEDMNSVFGDGTSVMPSPATLAEAESLFGDQRSPVMSMDLNRQRPITADHAIPGLDIDPPTEVHTDQAGGNSENRGEGFGGWISNMVRRTREEGDAASGSYKQLGQDDAEQ